MTARYYTMFSVGDLVEIQNNFWGARIFSVDGMRFAQSGDVARIADYSMGDPYLTIDTGSPTGETSVISVASVKLVAKNNCTCNIQTLMQSGCDCCVHNFTEISP